MLGDDDAGNGGTFHLLDADGRRIRVAGRHIEGRQPNDFALGPTLDGAAVADHHKQPGRQGCRLMITNDSPWRSDPRADRLG